MANKIKGYLATNKPKEAWECLKGWYCSATDQLPTPCYSIMAVLTAKRTGLYARDHKHQPLPCPIHALTDSKVWEGICQLQNGQAAGTGRMCTEHLKECLAGVVEEEKEGK